MKKIKNMNYQEAKKSFESFSKKNEIKDNYDMNIQIVNHIEEAVGKQGILFDAIYDVYCFGFMAGYKQKSKDFETKHNEHFAGSHEEAHRKLTELAYYLPFGLDAEYLYSFSVWKLYYDCPGIEQYLPRKQMKDFLEIVQNGEERKEQSEAEKTEKAEKTENKTEEPLLAAEEYKEKIIEIVNRIENNEWLRFIYRFMQGLTK